MWKESSVYCSPFVWKNSSYIWPLLARYIVVILNSRMFSLYKTWNNQQHAILVNNHTGGGNAEPTKASQEHLQGNPVRGAITLQLSLIQQSFN